MLIHKQKDGEEKMTIIPKQALKDMLFDIIEKIEERKDEALAFYFHRIIRNFQYLLYLKDENETLICNDELSDLFKKNLNNILTVFNDHVDKIEDKKRKLKGKEDFNLSLKNKTMQEEIYKLQDALNLRVESIRKAYVKVNGKLLPNDIFFQHLISGDIFEFIEKLDKVYASNGYKDIDLEVAVGEEEGEDGLHLNFSLKLKDNK